MLDDLREDSAQMSMQRSVTPQCNSIDCEYNSKSDWEQLKVEHSVASEERSDCQLVSQKERRFKIYYNPNNNYKLTMLSSFLKSFVRALSLSAEESPVAMCRGDYFSYVIHSAANPLLHFNSIRRLRGVSSDGRPLGRTASVTVNLIANRKADFAAYRWALLEIESTK